METYINLKYRRDLPKLMRELNLPMVGVECGVAEANFSNDLLEAGLEKLYSVDTWATIHGQKGDGGFDQDWHDANYAKAIARLAKHGDKSVILRGMSEAMSIKVPDNSLGLVYLDGDHSYEGVFNDILFWWPKLVTGGIMAFHDYEMTQYGVKRAVRALALEINLIPEDKQEDAGAWVQKK